VGGEEAVVPIDALGEVGDFMRVTGGCWKYSSQRMINGERAPS